MESLLWLWIDLRDLAGTPRGSYAEGLHRSDGSSRCATAAGYFEFDASPVRFLRGCYTGTMSRRDEVLVKHRKAIVAAAKRNKARTIALVGSVARGEDTEDSDYDFLVEFEKGITLFGIGRLEVALEDLLGCSVDVVPRSCLRESCSGMIEDAILL